MRSRNVVGVDVRPVALALLVAGLFPVGEPAAAQEIVLGPAAGLVVAPGGTVSVPVEVDMSGAAGQNLASIEFDLSWDPGLLTYVSGSSPDLPSGWSCTSNEEQAGVGILTLGCFSATGTTTTFDIRTITFTAAEVADPTNARIDLRVSAAGDDLGNDLLSIVQPRAGVVCIGLLGLLGDVNDDGDVNIIDAQQVARYSIGLPTPNAPLVIELGDANGDGGIDIIDAQQIARFSVGLPTPNAPNIGNALPGCAPAVVSVQVSPAEATIEVGETVQLMAQALDADENPLDRQAEWSSDAETVATVDDVGLVTGVDEGRAIVSATIEGVAGRAIITVQDASPAPADLVCGDLISDAIESAGEVDVLTFAGSAGDVVLVTVGETGGFTGSQSARVRIWSPTLDEVAAFNTNGQRQVTLPETGAYTIRVNGANQTDTGSYNLSYERLSPLGPVEAALVPGDLVSGALDVVAKVDLYSFEADAGDEILLTVGETGGFTGSQSARVRLWSPTLDEVVAFDTNGQQKVTLPETGTYVITVTGNVLTTFQTGSYNLSYERLSPLGPVEAALTCGDLVGNGIDEVAEVDFYTFSAEAEAVAFLALGETAGFSGSLAARATLVAPSGVQLASFDSPGDAEVTLPETGTYVIYVHGIPLTATGSYSIGLSCP